MMDAVVSRFPPPSHAPKACLVAGSKHYSDVFSHAATHEGENSEAGHFPAQTQLSDALVVGLRLGGV